MQSVAQCRPCLRLHCYKNGAASSLIDEKRTLNEQIQNKTKLNATGWLHVQKQLTLSVPVPSVQGRDGMRTFLVQKVEVLVILMRFVSNISNVICSNLNVT